MITKHEGFKVAGMVGNMSAEISEDKGYVEILLIDGEHRRSFDLGGLRQLTEDLNEVRSLAELVDRVNDRYRTETDGS